MSKTLAFDGSAATRPAQQRGVVMWVALIVLVIMTLAGLAMLRQMGGGVSIAGNLAFKENATSVADSGTEVAREWLGTAPAAATEIDDAAAGFYAEWGALLDPALFDWTNHSVPVVLDAATGNTVRYIVHRLCEDAGPIDAPTQRCSDVEESGGDSKAALGYEPVATPLPRAFFRVTVQVLGPRNTVSYTQVVLK